MSASGSSNSDYERACEIKDYVGVIDVLERHAIILGDMPLATTAWTGSSGPFIVRTFFMDPLADIQSMVEHAAQHDFWNEIESILFKVTSDDTIIFDSATSGSDLGASDIVNIFMHREI